MIEQKGTWEDYIAYAISQVPKFSQKSPIFSQKRPIFSHKSPIFSQKKPVFSQKSPTLSIERAMIEQKGTWEDYIAYAISQVPKFSQKSPIFSQKRPIFSDNSPIFSQKSPIFSQMQLGRLYCIRHLADAQVFYRCFQKSPIFCQKSLISCQKSPTLSIERAMFEQKGSWEDYIAYAISQVPSFSVNILLKEPYTLSKEPYIL